MTEHTEVPTSRKVRAPWGSKRGWQTRGAKFSPEELAWLDTVVAVLGNGTVDGLIHDAVTIHLGRFPELRPKAAA